MRLKDCPAGAVVRYAGQSTLFRVGGHDNRPEGSPDPVVFRRWLFPDNDVVWVSTLDREVEIVSPELYQPFVEPMPSEKDGVA